MQVQMLADPPRIPNFKTIPSSFVPTATTINDINRASTPRKPTLITWKLPGPLAIIAGIVRTSGLEYLLVCHLCAMIREIGEQLHGSPRQNSSPSLLLANRVHPTPTITISSGVLRPIINPPNFYPGNLPSLAH
jgi:hypothetical protein